jgi:hypothetical protein
LDHLGLVETVDGFCESVVVGISDAADGRLDTSFSQAFGVLDGYVLGGFNRSSQHSSKRGCDEEIQAAFGSVCASSFEIARPPPRGTAREL